ncbi:unnamed protein product [Boreogadus saida]
MVQLVAPGLEVFLRLQRRLTLVDLAYKQPSSAVGSWTESKDTGHVRRGPARVPESNVRKQHTGFATRRAGSGVHRRRGCLTARGAESNVRKQRTSFTARPAESTVRKQLPCTRI